MLVDASHAAPRTIAEAIAASTAPIAISDTGCRALNDVPRNTTDAELRALADKGGVAGIYFMPFLRTNGQPRAAAVLRHVEHAVKVAGEEHVPIGTAGGIRGFVIDADYAEVQRPFHERRKATDYPAPGAAAALLHLHT